MSPHAASTESQPAPSGQASSGGAPAARFPLALLVGCLAFELLLLAWSAFPASTMKADQPLESWFFLAGGQALFVTWLWPLLGVGGVSRRQATLEAVLLVVAGAPAVVPATWWVDASPDQVLAPCAYLGAWLLAGWLVVGFSSRPVRWAYAGAMTLANFGLLGLGYLSEDFLAGAPGPVALWRFSPMCQAARLAELGWPTLTIEQAASLVPAAAVLLVLLAAILLRPARVHPSAPSHPKL